MQKVVDENLLSVLSSSYLKARYLSKKTNMVVIPEKRVLAWYFPGVR
jgi:hypothetical protein